MTKDEIIDLLKNLKYHVHDETVIKLDMAIEDLNKEVSQGVVNDSQEPRKTGKWIEHQEGRWIYAKCSECWSIHDTVSKYCPTCGCLMNKRD